MRDLSGDRKWLAINTATVKSWSLEQAIAGCVRAGICAIAPWRDVLAQCGVAQAARLIRDAGLIVTCLCRGGMFTAADEAGRRAALDDNRRAIDEAAAIGAGSLVLVAGGLPAGSKDLAGAHRAGARRHRRGAPLCALSRRAARHRAAASHDRGGPCLYQHARARQRSLRRAGRGCGRCRRRLSRLVGSGSAAPDCAQRLAHSFLPRLRLAGPHPRSRIRPRHAGGRRHRSAHLRAMVEDAGYRGHCDVEIFSAQNWWKRDPDEVVRICLDRHQTVV